MGIVLTNSEGGQVQIDACLGCGKQHDQQAVCKECLTCPRCGSQFSQVNLGGDPMLARCLCCLKGWTMEIVPVKGVFPDRPEEELAFFARDPSPAFDHGKEEN